MNIIVDYDDRKTLVFTVEECDLRHVTLPFLVATLGEPLYVIKEPTDGEVGSPRRELTVEPEPLTVPVPETVPTTAPAEPVPA